MRTDSLGLAKTHATLFFHNFTKDTASFLEFHKRRHSLSSLYVSLRLYMSPTTAHTTILHKRLLSVVSICVFPLLT